MALVNDTIPNLMNGVSQQPPTLRLRTQGERQENGVSDLADGQGKRPAMDHVAKLNTLKFSDVFIHTIDRDAAERFVVVIPAPTIVLAAVTDITFTAGDTITAGSGTPFTNLASGDKIVVTGTDNNNDTFLVSSSTDTVITVDDTLGPAVVSESAGDSVNMRIQDIQVYDINGVQKTVTAPDGLGYLSRMTTASSLRAVTIADFTFIVNREVITAMDSTSGTSHTPEGLIYVRSGLLDTDYTVFIDGIEHASYNPLTDGPNSRTNNIATQLKTKLDTALSSTFTFTQTGNVIHVKRDNGAEFDIRSLDSAGDTALFAIKDKIQSFADLPPRAEPNFTVQVVGDDFNEFDNFWVRFDDSGKYTGIWSETVEPGLATDFDAALMPFQLVRESNGTFTFGQVAWGGRTVGDALTAGDPSFIGNTIAEIFFHNNRLGLLSEENVILSRLSEFFSFWPETVTALLDTDRIDIAGAGSSRVNLLNHAVDFNDKLVVFSDNVQFNLDSGDVPLTPRTVSLKASTKFPTSILARPVGAGQNLYFTSDLGGKNTNMREYRVDADSLKNAADEVTAHIPTYIPGNVFKMASAPSENTIFLLSYDDVNTLYVYRFFVAGSTKVQSSWSKWVFDTDTTIHNIDVVDGQLFLVIGRSDGTYLNSIDLNPGQTDDSLGFSVLLDRKVSLTGVFSTPKTTWTLPYSDDEATFVVVKGSAFGDDEGETIAVTRPGGQPTKIEAVGDFSAGDCFIGKTYTHLYELSEQVIRERQSTTIVNAGSPAIQSGRLQLKRMLVNYSNSGTFDVEVTPKGRGITYTYPFTGVVINNSVVGTQKLFDGEFRFPVMAESRQVTIVIKNDTHVPSNFLSAEWEGNFVLLSRRL